MCSPCPSHAFSVGPFRQGTQTCNTCDRSLPYVILSGGHRPIPATSRREGSQDDGLETGCQGLGRPPLSKHRFAGLSGGSFRPAATGMGRRCGLQDDNVHGQVSHTCGSWMLLGNGPPMNARGRGGAHTRVILRFDSLSVGARFIAPAIPTRRACHPRATRPPTLPDAPAILTRRARRPYPTRPPSLPDAPADSARRACHPRATAPARTARPLDRAACPQRRNPRCLPLGCYGLPGLCECRSIPTLALGFRFPLRQAMRSHPETTSKQLQ